LPPEQSDGSALHGRRDLMNFGAVPAAGRPNVSAPFLMVANK
jgi:hypothetical protein